jgi:hypothetical protein
MRLRLASPARAHPAARLDPPVRDVSTRRAAATSAAARPRARPSSRRCGSRPAAASRRTSGRSWRDRAGRTPWARRGGASRDAAGRSGARRRARVAPRGVPVQHRPAPAGRAVQRPREPRPDALHPARERVFPVCLDDQVRVIALERVVGNPEAPALAGLGEGVPPLADQLAGSGGTAAPTSPFRVMCTGQSTGTRHSPGGTVGSVGSPLARRFLFGLPHELSRQRERHREQHGAEEEPEHAEGREAAEHAEEHHEEVDRHLAAADQQRP